MRYSFAAALLFAAASAFANPSGQWTLLVPINPGTIPGSNGAVWSTSLWVTNTSDIDAPVACEHAPCPVVPAHTTTRITDIPFSTPHQGFFLGIDARLIPPGVPANATYVELRATDSATAAQSAGTEIPVVPPSAFRNTTIALPHVPVNNHSRSLLRVYGMINGTVRVRVVGVQSNQELMNTTVSLTGEDPARVSQIPFVRWPSYAQLALPDSYAGSSDDGVRIEITPSADDAIWAVVSVTDNVSQQFTIITPATGEYWAVSLA